MKPKKKQPVSSLLDQLNSYHDLSRPVNLPEAKVVGHNKNKKMKLKKRKNGSKKTLIHGQYASSIRTDENGKKYVWYAGDDGTTANASDEKWSKIPGVKKIYGTEKQLRRKAEGKNKSHLTDDYMHKVKKKKDGSMKFAKNNARMRLDSAFRSAFNR